MILHIILSKPVFYKDTQLSSYADLNSPQNHIRKLLTSVRETFLFLLLVKKNRKKDIAKITASAVFGSICSGDWTLSSRK